MDINPSEITYEVYTEKDRPGRRGITRRKIRPLNDDADKHDQIGTAIRSLLNKRRCIQLTHLLRHIDRTDGDTVTLHEILTASSEDIKDHREPDFGLEDINRELKLTDLDPSTLEPGRLIEVTRMKPNEGEPSDPKRGVVRETYEPTRHTGGRAEILWKSRNYSFLEGRHSTTDPIKHRHSVVVGRANMMGKVYDVQMLDPDETDDEELLGLRDSVLEALETKREAEEYEVSEESTWKSSAGEGNRATDLHARVTVSGPALSDPITVHCRNIWDFGWTATIEADGLDEDTERVVKAAVRENSPIPTGTRL
jgi:hypothetical protein